MPRKRKLTPKLMAEIAAVNAQIAALTVKERVQAHKIAMAVLKQQASANVRVPIHMFRGDWRCMHSGARKKASWNGLQVILCTPCAKKRSEGAMLHTNYKAKAAGAGK